MNVISGHLKDLNLISLQTGLSVGRTHEPVINPQNLKVEALLCTTEGRDMKALLMPDIRQITHAIIVIDSEDELQNPKDIIRLQKIIDANFSLVGAHVVSEQGTKLGKVCDYSVDTLEYLVRKINVKPPLYKNFLTDQLLIDRSQIVDVQPKKIIVRDAWLKEYSRAMRSSPCPTK